MGNPKRSQKKPPKVTVADSIDNLNPATIAGI
jgi:hypothetical protein